MATRVRTVRRALAGLALALAAVGALGAGEPPGARLAPGAGPPRVESVEVKGPITGGTAEYLDAALRRARDERLDAVAITLDTPGGALDATREIVHAMLESEVPVVVWVGPAGARAASAGTILTLAANVAAMHPASNIGAVHPVTIGGKDVSEEAGKDMAEKVVNDTVAFVRSICAERGRNADWAEKAVRQSVSVPAEEAVKLRVVDLLAPDLRGALDRADGRSVKVAGGTRVLHTKNAVLLPQEPTVRQRLLSFLADPNVVALLMLLGTLGIGIEFYHPGAILPGAVGAFCLLLAFLAMRVIPVNVGAVILVLAGGGLRHLPRPRRRGRRDLHRARDRLLHRPGLARLPVRSRRLQRVPLGRLADAHRPRRSPRLHGLEGGPLAPRPAPARRAGPRRRAGVCPRRRRSRGGGGVHSR